MKVEWELKCKTDVDYVKVWVWIWSWKHEWVGKSWKCLKKCENVGTLCHSFKMGNFFAENVKYFGKCEGNQWKIIHKWANHLQI